MAPQHRPPARGRGRGGAARRGQARPGPTRPSEARGGGQGRREAPLAGAQSPAPSFCLALRLRSSLFASRLYPAGGGGERRPPAGSHKSPVVLGFGRLSATGVLGGEKKKTEEKKKGDEQSCWLLPQVIGSEQRDGLRKAAVGCPAAGTKSPPPRSGLPCCPP